MRANAIGLCRANEKAGVEAKAQVSATVITGTEIEDAQPLVCREIDGCRRATAGNGTVRIEDGQRAVGEVVPEEGKQRFRVRIRPRGGAGRCATDRAAVADDPACGSGLHEEAAALASWNGGCRDERPESGVERGHAGDDGLELGVFDGITGRCADGQVQRFEAVEVQRSRHRSNARAQQELRQAASDVLQRRVVLCG